MTEKKQNAKEAAAQNAARIAQEEKEAKMPLSRMNYALMITGLAVVLVGFILMAGGGSDDPTVFNEKMFSFRRITLAPVLVIAGFVLEVFAIMWKFKK
jgi:hypothetical protein